MNEHRAFTGSTITDEADYLDKERFVEQNLWGKMGQVGKKISFAKDIFALFNYLRDSFVSWQRKVVVLMGLLYFILPIDAIPDLAPLVGYLDDLGVITAVLKFMGHELVPYYDATYRS